MTTPTEHTRSNCGTRNCKVRCDSQLAAVCVDWTPIPAPVEPAKILCNTCATTSCSAHNEPLLRRNMIGEKECRGYRPAIVEPAIDPQRGGGEKGMDAPVGGGQVYCDGCGKEKPLNQFPANPGVPGLCIPCNKIIAEQSGLQKCPKCGKEDEPLQKCFECGHEWYAPTAQDIMAVLQDEGWVNSMIDVVHKPYQGYWHDAINAFVAAVLERVNKTKGPHQPTDSRTNRKSR